MNREEFALFSPGSSFRLRYTCEPFVEADPVFSSSDENVATVAEDGTVTAVTPGNCTITLVYGDLTAKCKVYCRWDEASPEPSESVEPSGEPAESPAPSETPAGVDLAAFYSDLAASYDLGNMSQMDDETTEAHYPGLSDVSMLQCLHYAPMMTGVAREITLIQVENSADVDTVKGILQARVDAQVGGDAWYPAMIEQWQNYARIVSNGNYIMLAVHDGSDAMVDAFNALF